MTTETPLSGAEFAARMARLGPFESHPFLAVAVSGGADSLALTLLADQWARSLGGSIVGLTVDHGLRPEAAAEARQVGAWLAARGVAHEILVWRPASPPRNRQAAARQARYDLLSAWCRARSCLHLLTAHHREDQAETLLLRLARGSGLDGLAGIAPIREIGACRLLRPLLDEPGARMRAFLRGAGQGWIEDPSNADPRYARVRLRQARGILEREGLSPARLVMTARHLARARAALEGEVAGVLAVAVTLHPAGFALLDPAHLRDAPREVALRCLAQLVAMVGGGGYTPRFERLERLLDAALAETRPSETAGSGKAGRLLGRTLGGCRILPWHGAILVCREPIPVEGEVSLIPGETIVWDGRFGVRLAADAPDFLRLGGLGQARPALAEHALHGHAAIPFAVQRTLPAVRDLVGILTVPHLGYVRAGGEAMAKAIEAVEFRPRRPLTSASFTVV